MAYFKVNKLYFFPRVIIWYLQMHVLKKKEKHMKTTEVIQVKFVAKFVCYTQSILFPIHLYIHFPLRAPNLYYVYCRLRIWCCIRGYATFLEIQSTQIKMLNALFLFWLCKLVHLLSFKRGCNNGFDQLPSSIELYVYKLRIKPFYLQEKLFRLYTLQRKAVFI